MSDPPVSTDGDQDAGSSPYELFILGLSVLSLINFAVLVLPIRNTTKAVLVVVDTFSSIFFLIDFGQRLRRADSKREYFFGRLGWLDLLGSLPFPPFRLFRLVRVIRVIRTMSARGSAYIWQDLSYNLAEAAILFVVLLVIVTVEVGSLAVLWAERDAVNANIKNASDALWWCMATITTIGYGDKFPVSNPGRLVGVCLMIVGVGLFGTFTAFVADRFVHPRTAVRGRDGEMTIADEVRTLLRQQEQVGRELNDRLAVLESQLPRVRPPPTPTLRERVRSRGRAGSADRPPSEPASPPDPPAG